jgi:hypothetical protein
MVVLRIPFPILFGNTHRDSILVRWSPPELVSAGTVECSRVFSFLVDAFCRAWRNAFAVQHGVGFSGLEFAWFSVRTALAPGVSRWVCSGSPRSVGSDEFPNTLKFMFESCKPRFGIRDDHASAASGKQNHTKGCFGVRTSLNEITVCCDPNFVLPSPIGIASPSSDHRNQVSSFSELSPRFTDQIPVRVMITVF